MKKYTLKDIRKSDVKDTFFGTYFYRKSATYFTYFIARTSLVPNHVSFLSLFFTVAGSLLFAWGTFTFFFVGNILIQIGMILDYSDGQLARLKKLGTVRGAWLDVLLGMAQNAILVLGASIGIYVRTQSLLPLFVGFWVLFAWNMSCFVHLLTMIFFPKLELKKTKVAEKVKNKFFVKPQYLSVGSDVYFVFIGFSSIFGLLMPALVALAILGNAYWIAVSAYVFLGAKNAK